MQRWSHSMNAILVTKQKWHNGVSVPANVLEATAAHSNQALNVVCLWLMCDKMSVFVMCLQFAAKKVEAAVENEFSLSLKPKTAVGQQYPC